MEGEGSLEPGGIRRWEGKGGRKGRKEGRGLASEDLLLRSAPFDRKIEGNAAPKKKKERIGRARRKRTNSHHERISPFFFIFMLEDSLTVLLLSFSLTVCGLVLKRVWTFLLDGGT